MPFFSRISTWTYTTKRLQINATVLLEGHVNKLVLGSHHHAYIELNLTAITVYSKS